MAGPRLHLVLLLAAALSASAQSPPSAEDQDAVWEAARTNSLHYTASLPDFICTEVVKRYKDPKGKSAWKLSDTLRIQLTYFDHREEYRLVSIDNHPTTLSYEETGGAITEGEFGSMLNAVFSPLSRTERHWDRWTTLRGRPAHVYTFRISPVNSQYRIAFGTSAGGGKDITVGQHGEVYIDRDTNMVVRIVAEADGIPPDFPMRNASTLLDYGFTGVGGHSYLLPLHAETQFDAIPLRHRNEVQFLGYRKFSSDTSITYGSPVAPPVKK